MRALAPASPLGAANVWPPAPRRPTRSSAAFSGTAAAWAFSAPPCDGVSYMLVELRPFSSLTPNEKNAPKNDAGVDAVAASLREFGFRQPTHPVPGRTPRTLRPSG